MNTLYRELARSRSSLRLAGVDGPYALVSETVDHGHPILQHLSRVLGDDGQETLTSLAPTSEASDVLTRS